MFAVSIACHELFRSSLLTLLSLLLTFVTSYVLSVSPSYNVIPYLCHILRLLANVLLSRTGERCFSSFSTLRFDGDACPIKFESLMSTTSIG